MNKPRKMHHNITTQPSNYAHDMEEMQTRKYSRAQAARQLALKKRKRNGDDSKYSSAVTERSHVSANGKPVQSRMEDPHEKMAC